MPYVLKHKQTSEIFTCTLINVYDFPYHGTKFWEDDELAKAEFIPFLSSLHINELASWEVIEVEESQLKMFNVKLNNNPKRKLFLNEQGKPVVQTK